MEYVADNILLLQVIVPVVFGLMVLWLKRGAWAVSMAVSVLSLLMSSVIFATGGKMFSYGLHEAGLLLSLTTSELSSFILLSISFFSVLVISFSLKFFTGNKNIGEYYGSLLITLGAAAGVVLAGDFITLVVFWGISGFTLYQLIGLGSRGSEEAAKKSFVILGGTDALMILGICLIWFLTGTFDMSAIKLSFNAPLPIIAYLLLASGALAKAGAIPFHTWITDSSKSAPTTVMAYLPAALDKLLGIYLFAKISLEMFTIVPNSLASILLLSFGSITLIVAVLAALVQHNLKKLLAFHAVSQVGYMIIGIGTGIPLGIAGGLFHMLNNAIYKCCLFLGGGAIEKETGTTELDKLGGLASFMPVTFFAMMISALAISGIPPFNGFVSKWMIYQSLIETGKNGSSTWMIFLVVAMFGSALTLASFMKIINAAFLTGKRNNPVQEAPLSMQWPMIVLASLSIIFGVFAFVLPLKYFILPAVPLTFFTGSWSPILATLLILVGIMIGLVIFLATRSSGTRTTPPFIGGEDLPQEPLRHTGTDFYNTIKEMSLMKGFYEEAGQRTYDLYEQLKRLTFGISDFFKWMHSGLLHTYLAWCLLGLVLLLFCFFRGI